MERKAPNILITGTPGTGKTTFAQQAAEMIGFRNVNVGDIVRDKNCHEGKDEEGFDSFILDEEKLIDEMESLMEEGGNIVDFHSPEIFPERWFDLVLVLQTQTENLFDRLTIRGYDEKKKNENMECEIMQVVLEASRDSYDPDMVHVLNSNNIEDLEANVARVQQWYASWQSTH